MSGDQNNDGGLPDGQSPSGGDASPGTVSVDPPGGDAAVAMGWLSLLRAGVAVHGGRPGGVWMLLYAAYGAALDQLVDLPYVQARQRHLVAWDLHEAISELEAVAPDAVGTAAVDGPRLTGDPASAAAVRTEALLGCLRLTRQVLLHTLTIAPTTLEDQHDQPDHDVRDHDPLRDDPRRDHPSGEDQPGNDRLLDAARVDDGSTASRSGVGRLTDPDVLLAYARILVKVDDAVNWLAGRS